MIDISTYKDLSILQTLVDEIDSFIAKTELTSFHIDVGEMNVGCSINWKAVVVWDLTKNYIISSELQNAASSVIAIAQTMPGLQRITINFLGPMSVMPMHRDSEDYTTEYNMIIPLTNNGWFLLDDKVYKSRKNDKIIFNGCALHGVMNDSFNERKSIYLLIDKERFHDCA